MDERFKQYLKEQDIKPLDPEILKNYTKTMNEVVIPEITESIRQRERHAMELRFSPFSISGRKRKRD